MRRVFVFIAIGMGSGAVAGDLAEMDTFGWWIGAVTAFLLAAASSVLMKHSRGKCFIRTGMALCAFFIGGMLLQSYAAEADARATRLAELHEIEGTVVSMRQTADKMQVTVRTDQGDVLAGCYNSRLQPVMLAGKSVRCSGDLFLPQQRRNPGCFDYRKYLMSCGISAQMTVRNIEVIKGNASFLHRSAILIREHFARELAVSMKEPVRGMVTAMLFGDKSMLDREVYETFQKNGTAHILAVSGLHIGFLYGIFNFFWRGRKGLFFYGTASVLLFAYAALAEFSPSVVRAVLMILMHLGAGAFRRRYDLLTSTAFTFMLMLVYNPMQLFHTGFQLSFLAMASLGVILPCMKEVYSGIFLSSLAIQAGMMPYTAYLFNYISWSAFLVNVPVIFLAGILMPAAMSMIPFSFLCEPLFQAAALFLEQGCRILLWINDFFYMEGRLSFDTASPPVFFTAAYYGILFLAVSEKGRILFIRKKWKVLASGAGMVLLLSGLLAVSLQEGFSGPGVTFVDVGQGDCIHIRTPEGRNYMIDGGGSIRYDVGKKTLKPYLLKNGVTKLDAAFATHLHEDHFGGLRSLAQEGLIEKIGVYEGNRLLEDKLEQETDAELFYLYKGQRVVLGEGIFLDILAPERKNSREYELLARKQDDENAGSLIMKLTFLDMTVLITGDIDQEGEELLMKSCTREQLQCDVLKVAHHGSKYSSSEAFLDAASPEIAVFQVGRNSFGHPAPSVIENCRQKGIMVYRNDTSGAIRTGKNKDGSSILVQRMIE